MQHRIDLVVVQSRRGIVCVGAPELDQAGADERPQGPLDERLTLGLGLVRQLAADGDEGLVEHLTILVHGRGEYLPGEEFVIHGSPC